MGSPGKAEDSSGKIMSYRSPELESPGLISCIGTFDTARSFNSIRIKPHPELRDLFPIQFGLKSQATGSSGSRSFTRQILRGGFLGWENGTSLFISARIMNVFVRGPAGFFPANTLRRLANCLSWFRALCM